MEFLFEGGNVTATTKSGTNTRSEKIDLKKLPRQKFIKIFNDVFKKLNALHKSKFKESLWKDESKIANGFMFNGSTSFIMNPNYTDEEIIKYKQYVGDIDIIVPEQFKENLWKILDELDEKEVIKDVVYMGSNRPNISSIGTQINSVFLVNYEDMKLPCQVDFEFLEFENGGNDSPTEWSKFSHGSSFEDTKEGIKAVFHKYLLRALVGSIKMRDDIVIATPASTPDKIRLKKTSNPLINMLKFSVDHGVRNGYAPFFDETGKPIFVNGKQVFKEIDTKNSDYKKSLDQIYEIVFGDIKSEEIKNLHSFIGILELINKYAKQSQKVIHDRFIDLLWGKGGQEIERDNPKLDLQIKLSAYLRLIKEFKLPNKSEAFVKSYYKTNDFIKYIKF